MKRIATGYQCQLCQYENLTRGNMYTHLRTKHPSVQSFDNHDEITDAANYKSPEKERHFSLRTIKPKKKFADEEDKPQRKSDERQLKKMCDICQEMYDTAYFQSHTNRCRFYSEFISKTPNGYKCRLCRVKKKVMQSTVLIMN